MSELTHEDVRRILAIIDSIGDRTVSFEYGDIKLHMTRSGAAAVAWTPASREAVPAQDSAAAATPTVASVAAGASGTFDVPTMEVPEGMVAVTAPTSGTFYRAGSPTARPFVEIGDHVDANDTVAVFDVMKLFMSLRAGVNGTVTAILVENQAVAEQGQPLVLIKPD